MWNERKFEKHMFARLEAECTEDVAHSLAANYTTARTELVKNIYKEIKGVDQHLSDHGVDHIANVLDNLHYLLSDNHEIHGLKAMDLYLLGIIVLFHDVGNLFGRNGHQKKVGEIFEWARGNDPDVKREKTLVLQAVASHTGQAVDGTLDTLKQVSELDHLYGETVRLRDLAAILRFADELAEGPQRTSAFLLDKGMILPKSVIFHKYAEITNIQPDRGTGRVMVTYEIDLQHSEASTEAFSESPLRELLEFAYGRVVKLDQERRYARFYSKVLMPFDNTTVALNFHYDGYILQPNLPPLILNDKVIPGSDAVQVPSQEPLYNLDSLIPALRALAKEAKK